MFFAIQIAGAREGMVKIIEVDNIRRARERMKEYMAENATSAMYRVIIQPNGDILLKKLRVKAGSEVYEQRLIDVEFEDA